MTGHGLGFRSEQNVLPDLSVSQTKTATEEKKALLTQKMREDLQLGEFAYPSRPHDVSSQQDTSTSFIPLIPNLCLPGQISAKKKNCLSNPYWEHFKSNFERQRHSKTSSKRRMQLVCQSSVTLLHEHFQNLQTCFVWLMFWTIMSMIQVVHGYP